MKDCKRLIPWTLLIPVFTILTAIGLVVCLLNDWEDGCAVLGLTGLFLLIMQVVCALVLLFSRKFGWFFAHVGLLILAFAIWFLGVIIVAMGQRHAPMQPDAIDTIDTIETIETIDTIDVAVDSVSANTNKL